MWIENDPVVAKVIQAVPDLEAAAYLLGYLSPPWCTRSAISLAGEENNSHTVLARYTDGVTHSVIAFGTAAAIAAILQSPPVADWRMNLRINGHPVWVSAAESTLEGFFPFMIAASSQAMECLVVDAGTFQPSLVHSQSGDPNVVLPQRLTIVDAPVLNSFYNLSPDDAFARDELTTGIYYAIRATPTLSKAYGLSPGALIAVAGTPFLAPAWHIATLGNVLTLPECRGHGYATSCTSMLTKTLLAEGYDAVVLTVALSNQPATHLYRQLGFRQHATYTEARMVVL